MHTGISEKTKRDIIRNAAQMEELKMVIAFCEGQKAWNEKQADRFAYEDTESRIMLQSENFGLRRAEAYCEGALGICETTQESFEKILGAEVVQAVIDGEEEN